TVSLLDSGFSSNSVRASLVLQHLQYIEVRAVWTKGSDSHPVFTTWQWSCAPGTGRERLAQDLRTNGKVKAFGEMPERNI
ncbi:unnamed protein product, partial [Ilex paraguariensis]